MKFSLIKKVGLTLVSLTFLVAGTLVAAPSKLKVGEGIANGDYKKPGGETKAVTVEGMAEITASGEQDADGRALQKAMRNAVESVLGAMVQSTTLVNNGALVEDKIYSKASGFVQKYDVLETSRKGNTRYVKIKAYVVLGDVKQDAMALGLLQDRVGRPMVMIIVDDPSLETGAPMGIMNALLQDKMMEKQFQFVDKDQMEKVLAKRNLTLAKAGGVKVEELASAALDAGAQILVSGKVVSSAQNLAGMEGMIPANFKSCSVTLSLSVLYAADARVLASASKEAKGAGLSLEVAQKTALGKAVTNKGAVADELIDKVIKQWDNMVNNGFEYTLIVSGISADDADDLQGALEKNVEGIKKVFSKGFEGDKSEYTIRYTGMINDLAKFLRNKEKMPFKLETVSRDSRTIIMKKAK